MNVQDPQTEHDAATPDTDIYPHHYVGMAGMITSMLSLALLVVLIPPAVFGMLPVTVEAIGWLALVAGLAFITSTALTVSNGPIRGWF